MRPQSKTKLSSASSWVACHGWLCAAILVALVIVTGLIFRLPMWTILVAALMLGCIFAAIVAYVIGTRPLPPIDPTSETEFDQSEPRG